MKPLIFPVVRSSLTALFMTSALVSANPVITPPPPAAPTILFGEFTGVSQGAAGIDVADATYGEFTVSAGVITPNTSPLTVGTYDVGGQEVVVNANEASCTDAELLTVFNAASTSLAKIGVRAGTAMTARRTLPAKAFTDLTIEPYGYTTNADPRISIRPVVNGGLVHADTATNVTITGFSFYTEANEHMMGRAVSGVITNCHYYDCEAAGENLYTVWNDNRMHSWNEQARIGGVFSSSVNSSVKHCYIHDVHRGLSEGGSTGILWEDNYILHVYQNFTNNVDSTDGIIRNNKGQHVWGANTDITDPHTASGGSFGQQCVNMLIEHNVLCSGYARAVLHNTRFLAGTLPAGETNTAYPTQGITGLKMNEDGAAIHPNYSGCIIRNNLINTRGLALQIEGGLNCTINNNTVVTNQSNTGGSSAIIGIAGMDSCEMWNNVVSDYYIGVNDNTGGYVRSLDDLQGYYNLAFAGTPLASMFAGDATKGFSFLDIDELEAAFQPLPGTVFAVNGVGFQATTDTFVMPVATGGTSAAFSTTVWDGSAYVSRADAALGATIDGRKLLLKFRGSFGAAAMGITSTIIGGRTDRVQWIKTSSDTVELYIKAADNVNPVFKMRGTQTLTVDVVHDIAFGVDLDTLSYFIAIDGVLDPLCSVTIFDNAYGIDSGSNLFRAFASKATTPADYFIGTVDHLYMTDEYIDGNTAAGLNAIFTADGGSRDYGAAGVSLTGTQPRLYLYGDAAGFSNKGTMGPVVVNGTVTDDVVAPSIADIDMAGVAVDLDPEGVGLETSYVLAMRLTKKNAATMYLFNSGTNSSDSRWLLRVEDDHYFTLESNTGTRLFSGALFGSLAVDGTESIYIRVQSGDIEVIIDGVSVFTDTTTFSSVKGPRYLFTGDAGTTSAGPILHGGFWVSNDTPAYSDLFDGSNLPLWTGTTLGAFTALAAPTTASEINALSGTVGTAV